MLTRTAQRTMRLRTLNVGLEMDYPCICGRRFASERGMKIHRTKMGCLNKSFQQQRTALADKTSENQSRAQNHSAKEIQAEDQDEELRQLINAKRQKINFPAATAVEQWGRSGQQNSPEARLAHRGQHTGTQTCHFR
ncbi:reverse transcriptase [Elysia marginata]|uniref:Reverse transcriptase n=1 Tax=Elysia marginata TaxID=1093978 RepID=A0AAV4GN82_9GAST|nr:reverse transcriptase [Elysia marginata]